MINARHTLRGSVNSRQKLSGKLSISTIKIQPELEDITITPTKEQQIFTHENSDGYNKITVSAIPEIKLQDKEVIPTKETQNIVADNNYDALNQVTIEPIPEEYIIPDGMLPITENTTYDVRRYARVSANVHPAPNLQDKSITITENGTQNISADSGYDGLGNVEVITNIEGSSGSEESIETLDDLPTFISTSILKQLEGLVNQYPTYTTDSVTLYTPNADYRNYIIRKRGENQYGIIWFPNIIITCLATGYIRSCKGSVSDLNITNNVSIPLINYTHQNVTGYYTANYTSFEECVEALQNPNTSYSSTTAIDWGNQVDGDYTVSATNCVLVSGATRRISSNETIEVIG